MHVQVLGLRWTKTLHSLLLVFAEDIHDLHVGIGIIDEKEIDIARPTWSKSCRCQYVSPHEPVRRVNEMDIAQTPNQRKTSDEPVNLILPPHNTMVGSSNASDKHIAATWYHPSKLGPPLRCIDHQVLLLMLLQNMVATFVGSGMVPFS